jgi:hypothetical protein
MVVLKIRPVQLLTGAVLLGWLAISPLSAMASGAISQSYTTNSNVAPGSILSQVATNSASVEPATNTGQAITLVGVAVNQTLLELSSTSQHGVQVAVSGTAETLVCDINGSVKAGDKITASPLTGVGMKAIDSGQIIGTAQQSLSSVSTVKHTVADHTGKTTSVLVGLIPVTVNVEYFSASAGGSLSAFVPPFLQNLANAISGKQVSPLRVLLSVLIVLFGFITVIVILNAGIRSGLISLGRNPLAERALRKGLVDVALTALGALLVIALIVYAILTG